MNRLTYTIATAYTIFLAASFTPHVFADEGSRPDFEAFGVSVSDNTLASNRGGYTIETNTNNVNAKLYNNQANNNATGSNFVTSGAFAGTSGFATLVQNSGNNVIIQNATVLNLKMQ